MFTAIQINAGSLTNLSKETCIWQLYFFQRSNWSCPRVTGILIPNNDWRYLGLPWFTLENGAAQRMGNNQLWRNCITIYRLSHMTLAVLSHGHSFNRATSGRPSEHEPLTLSTDRPLGSQQLLRDTWNSWQKLKDAWWATSHETNSSHCPMSHSLSECLVLTKILVLSSIKNPL